MGFIELIPSDIKTFADSKILKAKSIQKDNTISFLFFTDPHITEQSSFTDINVLNYVSNNLKVEFIACCGDNLDNVASKQQHLDVARKYIERFADERFFTVKGNHDDNSIQSEGYDNIRFTMLPQEQYEIMFRRLENMVSFDTSNKDGLYYYYDMPQSKIRAIFLNSIDIPYIPDKEIPNAWKYSGQSTYAYSDRQLNWIANKALKLPSKEWKVMFFTHINPFNEDMIGADHIAHNSQVLLDIIHAFQKGAKYTSVPSTGDFEQNVSADYSDQGKGQAIAFFYGHTHSEQVHKKEGITYISTWNDCPRKSESNPDAPTRIAGTMSELCFNIVTIDLEKDKIIMTKVGVGEDLIIDIN
jgi:predicted phosphodiesterase